MNFDVLPNEIIVHICRFDSEAYNIISRLSRHHYALSKVITDPKKWFSRYINGFYYAVGKSGLFGLRLSGW